mmetsp:Transcript_40402/g.90586  ORF Transcript_40402/g.90586 Transcript_40402/m.90586 type:complete len:428 (+) Transcript_40402:196-1479(+)
MSVPNRTDMMAPTTLDPAHVKNYLESYGYKVLSSAEWARKPAKNGSVLDIIVDGHLEEDGHTHYRIVCTLTVKERQALRWLATRRLSQIREELHDIAKTALAASYDSVFTGAPFAIKGAPAGTTSRLQKWLGAFAASANQGIASPHLVAQAFYFLAAPIPETLAVDCKPDIASLQEHVIVGPDEGLREVSSGGAALEVPDAFTSSAGIDEFVGSDDANPDTSIPDHESKAAPAKSSTASASSVFVTLSMQRQVPQEGAERFLAKYGYDVMYTLDWRMRPSESSRKPKLKLRIQGHSESGGCTLYRVECSLAARKPELLLEWDTEFRLSRLRESLHDIVKAELGRSYGEAFSEAPFASRGAPKGTSKRLEKWLATLAWVVNDGIATPNLAAHVLLCLEVPLPPEPIIAETHLKGPLGSTVASNTHSYI